MGNRTQITLAGLLVLQVALILLFRSPFTGASTSAELHPLLPGLEAFSPERLELQGEEDKTLTLRKQGQGWVVQQVDDFPADATKVDEVLKELREIKVRRPVVTSPRYHAAFEVTDDENQGRIRIWDAQEGEAKVDLILGSSPNYQITHVRKAGDDPVYEARGIAAYEFRPEASGWVDKDLVDIEESQLVGVKLTNGAGSFELAREEGNWKVTAPADQAAVELDGEKVESLLRTARTIRLADAIGKADPQAQGFADPAASLELRRTAPDGTTETVVVQIGGRLPDKDSQRYVTRAGWGFAGTIWESSIQKLLDEPLSALAK
jgi:hypothetical protein